MLARGIRCGVGTVDGGRTPAARIWVTLPYMTVTQKVQSPGTVAGTGRAGRRRALATLALSGLMTDLDSSVPSVDWPGATAS
jgi:hypothetical protein